MESVAAHKDEVAPVESKIDELKRKSVDSKETTDHESKNGNDEPKLNCTLEAGDNASDDKAHSPDSRHAEAESEEDGTDDDASQDTKGTNGTSEHVNGSNGERISGRQDESNRSDDGSESESEKGDDAPSVDKESDEDASD
ncbi:prothymosin alpha-B [Schistosoma japonicum]|nr:prothymosin alpha-B [Schistosoma japonicum]